ncbi:MAG: rod shape-determining protein MreC, partial [Paramuribaculum sp.]|nr:rod shape-determining protein MreC [Paramuribaculum sp.]
MRNLLNFLLRYSAWLLFIVYATVGCILLFNSNPYQHHVWLTTANMVTAGIYGAAGNGTYNFS